MLIYIIYIHIYIYTIHFYYFIKYTYTLQDLIITSSFSNFENDRPRQFKMSAEDSNNSNIPRSKNDTNFPIYKI